MTFDLIRALLAAGIVCVIPGWFWAKLLCATEDRVERLAYAVGVSITLVPTAALVQARFLGVGVSLLVTIISIVVVCGVGFAAYRRFGPAKGTDAPIISLPAAPGLPTLIPLSLASVLMLGAFADVLPFGRIIPPVALLMFAAGAAYLLTTPAKDEPTLEAPAAPRRPVTRYVLLSVVFALVLLRGYLGPVLFDWPYMRGDDQYQHTVMTSLTISQGDNGGFMLYPPGLHLLLAEISQISFLEPLKLFPVLAPMLLVLPPLALYALGRRLWGWEVGVAAAAFSGLLLTGPYWYFEHGRYSNLISAQFLLVLAIAVLVRLYYSPSARTGLLLALLGSSVVLHHMVGSFYEAALLALAALMFLPYLLMREPRTGVVMFLSFALLGVLSVLYAWDTYDLPKLVAGFLGGSETGKGGEAVSMAIGTKPAPTLDHTLIMTSQSVLWIGLLGTMMILINRRSVTSTADAMARATLLIWGMLLFVGSRTPLSAFPDRFELDFGIPLALLAALALVALLRSLGPSEPVAVMSAGTLAVFLVAALMGLKTVENLVQGGSPSSQLSMTPEIAAAGEWLEAHNNGGNIVSTPYLKTVPSRAMLALGGYSGIQSFRAERIERNRDLPPSGAKPLKEALWILQHPEGERTARLIEEHDIRYLVFYKRHVIEYQPFEAQPDLYRTTFENEDVIIFAPRERK